MWIFGRAGPSGFSCSSTAEQVAQGIDGTGLTAIVTGPFHLTNLLLETMKSTALESQKEGRIVNLSSVLHKSGYKGGILFDKINDESSYDGNAAYGQPKLCNLLHTNKLARNLKAEGANVTAISLHSELIATNITNNLSLVGLLLFTLGKYFLKMFLREQQLHAMQVKGVSGEYFVDSKKQIPAPPAPCLKILNLLRNWGISA